ncbi:MAG TPA: UDP binding domain-containing protein, partial [Allosphingosinicella sp.]
EAVVKVNDSRKRAMGRRVIRALGEEARGKTVALLGLTFKPNTDDMRDAPSVAIFQALEDVGVKVRGYDPEGTEQARPMMPGMTFCDNPYDAAQGADTVVLVTEWDVLRALDLKRLKTRMTGHSLIDLRNVYTPEEVIAAGFDWQGVGKPAQAAGSVGKIEQREPGV